MHADELAEVIGDSADLVTIRLREAVASGTVEIDDDGAYWFHHPLSAESSRPRSSTRIEETSIAVRGHDRAT